MASSSGAAEGDGTATAVAAPDVASGVLYDAVKDTITKEFIDPDPLVAAVVLLPSRAGFVEPGSGTWNRLSFVGWLFLWILLCETDELSKWSIFSGNFCSKRQYRLWWLFLKRDIVVVYICWSHKYDLLWFNCCCLYLLTPQI